MYYQLQALKEKLPKVVIKVTTVKSTYYVLTGPCFQGEIIKVTMVINDVEFNCRNFSLPQNELYTIRTIFHYLIFFNSQYFTIPWSGIGCHYWLQLKTQYVNFTTHIRKPPSTMSSSIWYIFNIHYPVQYWQLFL